MSDYGKPTKDEPRKIQKVVTGSAQTKKKSDIRKVADVFVSEDIHNVKSYVIFDVIVPRIMDMLSEALKGSVDMVFGGGGRRKEGRSSNVSYRQYYDDKRDRDRYRGETSHSRERFDFDEITYNYRGDAEAVLNQMEATIDRYGLVTVGDMYDMANLPQPHTSNRYGWTNLRNAEVVRQYGKYVIKLPKAMPID